MSFLGGHWYPCFGFLVMSPLGFKVRVGSALFTFCGGECNVHSLRSTSGATLANLLAASLQNICQPDALPTELNRDQHFGVNLSFSPNVIVIDGRQSIQICNWDYFHLAVDVAFIFTILIVHLIFGHFSSIQLNLLKIIVVGVLLCFSFNNGKWAQLTWTYFFLMMSAKMFDV